MNFNSNFKYDLERGKEGEEIVAKIFKSSPDKFEIKRDSLSCKTGNLFVEFESRGKPSGIKTSQADYWVFIIEGTDVIIFIGKENLLKLCKKFKSNSVKGGDNNTSRGILIPIKEIHRHVF